ncbi:hypothetical protein [Macrococcus sp. DPC7161]|uniref:hypothetical protein n=1 Tax=Macrococcus sp. DPC7161 TaxID=2507060 RepID=UPI0026CD4745
MRGKLNLYSRVTLVIAAITMFSTLFMPWWKMKFYAPQYPEGLNIIVHPNTLKGEIDIINGLNHYIGMSEFSNASFPELKYFPILVVGFTILLLIAAFIRKKSVLLGLIIIFIFSGVLGLWDMYRWLHKYGTELAPNAPIKVDPFVPPIVGKNTLANFTTYSSFSIGGYLLFGVFILMIIAYVLSFKESK